MKVSPKTPKAVEAIAPKTTPWWYWAIGAVLVLFIAFEVYGPSLNGEFLFDDSYLPFLMPGIADSPLGPGWLGTRPVLMLSYWLNYQSSGLNPYPYHVVGVLLHALNAILVGVIVRRLLGWAGEVGWTRNALSIFGGALFLLHPLQTESVAYVASRSETLSVFFVLATYAVFIYRRGEAATILRIVAILVLLGLAALSKEHAAALPALFLLTDYYFITPFKFTGIRRNWKLYAPIVLGGLVAGAYIYKVLQSAQTAGFKVKEFTPFQYLLTQFRVIWLYFRLYVLPLGQNADWEFPISRTPLDYGAIFYGLALLAGVVLAWRYRKQYPLASFGYLGTLILLAPTSSFVPIRDVAVERRTYLPFICLLMITVDLVRRWKAPRATVAVAMTAVCAVAGVLSYQRAAVWGSAYALWEDTAAKSPTNTRARFQLAYAQWQAGKCRDAVANYEQVAKLQVPDERLLIDWAYALECDQKPDEAVAKLRDTIKAAPSAHAYSVIGMIYGKRGRAEEALAALAEAERLDSRFEMTYVYRGNIYASQGQMPAAAAEYQKAIVINPSNQSARDGLAMTQARR